MKYLITGGSGFIGTHLIDELIKRNCSFINIDIERPKKESHLKYYQHCDILDKESLTSIINEYQPTNIIHLAATTDVSGKSLDYYKANIDGVKNLISAIKICKSIERIVITSTQYVHQFKHFPKNDEEFYPFTIYGQSKVLTEKITREAGLNCCWTIIRPTNIWGPYHNIYPEGFWKVLRKGYYFHPGKKKVIRSYGYVENVIFQILKILTSDYNKVNKKVFYVSDEPINLYDWTNAFSIALTGKNIKVVPRTIIKFLAVVGEVLKYFNIGFPIHLDRYRNMIIDNPVPIQKTIDLVGKSPFSLSEGVEISVRWYENEYLKILHNPKFEKLQ